MEAVRRHPAEGIPFGQRIRVTSHHGEFDEIEGSYSSVAYWYQKHWQGQGIALAIRLRRRRAGWTRPAAATTDGRVRGRGAGVGW